MSTMNVLDASGATVVIEKPLAPGRADASASRPVALSNEDAAFLDGLETALAGLNTLITATNTALGTLNTAVADTTTDSPVAPHQPCAVPALTPVLDTSIYASGDVLFVTTALTGAARANDKCFQIQSLQVIDKDDQKPAMRLFYFYTNVTFGTINSAPSISDSDAASYLGHIDVAASDYVDLGGVSVASLTPACGTAWRVGPMKPVSGGTTIYVAAMLTAGTPTHTASGIVLNHGVVQG